MTAPQDLFWSPSPADAARSAMAAFRSFCAERDASPIDTPQALQRFSLERPALFWRCVLDFAGFATAGAPAPEIVGREVERARFFPELRLNYTANVLRDLDGAGHDALAIVGRDESGHRITRSRGELRREVLALANALRGFGIGPGDRVAAVATNSVAAIVACLASAAVGATWSSVAPDLGLEAASERLRQLRPRLLFAVGAFRYHGAWRDVRSRLLALLEQQPTIEHLVALGEPLRLGAGPAEHALADLTAGAVLGDLPLLPFDHPLFVLFSSGTTGKPKAIVHGAGGTLLEHWKEQRLHSDLGPRDLLYFHTTCGWMMWNWQLSALATGAAIAVYDGSVSHPRPDALLSLLREESVSVFGTSPAYLQFLREAGIEPGSLGDWPRLRAIQSTGSVLYDAQYDWVREHWKHVPVQSISGGTDIVGCFVLGHPELPVFRGESQCISLGYDVRVHRDGRIERTGEGELVCCAPFPSRPVGFLEDPDGSRFHAAYFAEHEGVWTHGDFIRISERGSARVLGRSDGTLNIKGVRIGPAEIYGILQGFPGLVDCMAIEQRAPLELGGSRLVLLVVLAPGQPLDRPFVLRLKKELSQRGSPNHVPAVVAQVSSLPTTFSGKKSERAATEALHGREVRNRQALRNPESLDEIARHPELRPPPS